MSQKTKTSAFYLSTGTFSEVSKNLTNSKLAFPISSPASLHTLDAEQLCKHGRVIPSKTLTYCLDCALCLQDREDKSSRLLKGNRECMASSCLLHKYVKKPVCTKKFMNFSRMQPFVGRVECKVFITPSQGVKVSFTALQGKRLSSTTFEQIGGHEMLRSFRGYLERLAVDDLLTEQVVKHCRTHKHFQYQSGYDFDFSDEDEIDAGSGVRMRQQLYCVGETIAAFIGNYRAIKAYRRQFGKWDLGLISRSVHHFCLGMGFKTLSLSAVRFAVTSTRSDMYEALYESEDVNFMLYLLSVPFQDKHPSRSKFSTALYNYKRMGGTKDMADLGKSAVSFFIWLWEVGTTAFEMRSLSPFFHSGPSYVKWFKSANHVIADYAKFEEGSMGFHEYIRNLDRALEEGYSMMRACEKDRGPGTTIISRTISQLEDIKKKETLARRLRREREPPFIIGLYGNPGSGKTSFIHYLNKLLMEFIGQDFDPSTVFSFNSADAYASGMRTFQEIFVVDDLDIIPTDVSPQASLSAFALLMEVANSVPKASNQAALEDKGNVFAHPKFVVLTSNSDDFGARGPLKTPTAFLRRIGFRVHLHVLPQYAIPGTNELDASKLPGHWVFAHTFSVIRFRFKTSPDVALQKKQDRIVDPSNVNTGYFEEIVLDHADHIKFFTWLKEQVLRHFENSKRMLKMHHDFEAVKHCDECFYPLAPGHICGLPHIPVDFVEQEDEETACPCGDQSKCDVCSLEKRSVDTHFCSDVESLANPAERVRYVSLASEDENALDEYLLKTADRQGGCQSAYHACIESIGDDVMAIKRRKVRQMIDALWNLGNLKARVSSRVKRFFELFASKREWHILLPELFTFGAITFAMTRPLDLRPLSERVSKEDMPVTRENKDLMLFQRNEVPPVKKEFQSAKIQESRDFFRDLDRKTPANVWLSKDRPSISMHPKNASATLDSFVPMVKKNMVIFKSASFAHGLFLNTNLLLVPTHSVGKLHGLTIYEKSGTRVVPDNCWRVAASSKDHEMLLLHVEGFQKKDISWVLPYDVPFQKGYTSVQAIAITDLDESRDVRGEPMKCTLGSSLTPVDVFNFPNINSKEGDCGSVYLTLVNKATPVLFAFHVGGGTDGAVGLPLSWSQFSDWNCAMYFLNRPLVARFDSNGLKQCPDLPFENFASRGVDSLNPNSYVAWAIKEGKLPSHVRVIGNIGYSPGGSFKTKIQPSLLQGQEGIPMSVKVPPDMKPIFVDGEKFTQARLAHEAHWEKYFPDPDFEHLDLAIAIIKNRRSKVFAKYPKTYPLTETESLNGLNGVRYVDKINHQTGAGLPLRGSKFPRLIHGVPENLVYTSTGKESVQFIADRLMAGENPGIIFDICFKDEVKKPSKPIRVFSACPAPYNEMMRRGFLLPQKIMQENYLITGLPIGVDVRSRQWRNIYRMLKKFAKTFWWDFKKYDKSHHWRMMLAACQILLWEMHCMYKSDATICGYPVLNLMAAGMVVLCNPHFNFRDTVFGVPVTLASGLFCTAQINSIIQEILLQLSWIDLKGVQVIAEEYRKSIDSFAMANWNLRYGDDGGVATNDPDFNLRHFAASCATRGYEVTSPDKSAEMPDSFPESSWSFLKRSFNDVDGITYAPIEEESILKNINWYTPNSTFSAEQGHYEFVTSALQECASTGDDRFRELYDAIVIAFHRVFPENDYIFPSFEEQCFIQRKAYLQDKDGAASLWKMAQAEDPVEFAYAFWR